MRIEIDQSGRFEYTKQQTVVAFSNGTQFSILIPAKVKRKCIAHIRGRGIKPPRLQTMLFATTLYLLLKDHVSHLTTILIDKEYFGNEGMIKSHLMNLMQRSGRCIKSEQIQFGLIGKKSPAHHVAIETFRGNIVPNRIVTLEDMMAEL